MLTMPKSQESVAEKNNPTVINAWCSYDWANSVYNLAITSTIFPVYYSNVTREAFGGEEVPFLGWAVSNTVLYSYAISFSFLMIVLISPFLSGIADYSGRKKLFMQIFTWLGALSCMGLFFFTGINIELGILFSVLASLGYAGSLVFYNAFLPEISTPDRMDKISARGFSMGYIGSVILLIISLLLIFFFDFFGFEGKSMATRFTFLLVGIWWLGFSQIAFYFLKDRNERKSITSGILLKGMHELQKVFAEVRKVAVTPKFLLSFFFYSMGVQSFILLAPLYGESVIGLSGELLILTVLIVQLVAIGGSYLFAWVSSREGNKAALLIMLFIWISLCTGAFFLQTEGQFFGMAVFFGLVLGGTQSISRSSYSKLIPQSSSDTASYFSLYEITEKTAIVLGTFTFGFITQFTEDMRYSTLAWIVFFAVGVIVLARTPFPKQTKIKA